MRGCLGVMVILEDGMEDWAPLSGQRVRLGGVFRQENFQRLVTSDGGASGQLESDSTFFFRPLAIQASPFIPAFLSPYLHLYLSSVSFHHAWK